MLELFTEKKWGPKEACFLPRPSQLILPDQKFKKTTIKFICLHFFITEKALALELELELELEQRT